MSREAWLALLALGGLIALASAVGAVILAIRVWRTRRMLTELGAAGKFAFYGALIYTVFPIDVLPDPIYLDDLGVLTAALIYLSKLVRQHRAAQGGLPGGLPGGGRWPDPRRFATPPDPRRLPAPPDPRRFAVPPVPPPGTLPPASRPDAHGQLPPPPSGR
ncbi:YkvA family protein [Plantactinospora siamensis]|uniref:YkvA family protein n=1 Tax=Plantactinospora siamensis TaxID=555372 RepID=A0ABV6NXQ6_9ACTN